MKAPANLRSLARAHTETAINILAGIMTKPDATDTARVSAASAILDRGWGKPSQPISGDDEGPAVRIETILRKVIDPEARDTDSAGVPAASE